MYSFFFYKSCWPSSRTVSTNLKKCRLKVNIPLQFAMFLLKAKEGGKRKLFSFNFQQSTYLFSNSFSFCLPFLAPTGAFYVLVCHPARPVSQFSLSPLILSMIHSMTSWGHLLLHLLFLLSLLYILSPLSSLTSVSSLPSLSSHSFLGFLLS